MASVKVPSRGGSDPVRQPTLADVAEQAGVSLATASRALNGSRNVAADLRAKVLAAVEALGYVPNANARMLAGAMTSTVGVLVHDVGDPYFSAVTRGIMQVATAHGLLAMICETQRDPAQELHYISVLHEQRVRAIVLTASGFADSDYIARLQHEAGRFESAGGRIVVVSRHDVDLDTVMPDNRQGGVAVGTLLTQLGHRHIGVLSGPDHLLTVVDRLDGFRTATRSAGVDLPDDLVVEDAFNREGGYRAAQELLDREPRLTAVFALNDLMALGALAAIEERGIRVPEELSVVGFDDLDLLQDVRPLLTTVRVPMGDLGRRAMELALETRQRARHTVARMPVELVVRESTATPRTGRRRS